MSGELDKIRERAGAAEARVTAAAAALEPWTARFDSESKRYYYNPHINASVRELPSGTPAAAAAKELASAQDALRKAKAALSKALSFEGERIAASGAAAALVPAASAAASYKKPTPTPPTAVSLTAAVPVALATAAYEKPTSNAPIAVSLTAPAALTAITPSASTTEPATASGGSGSRSAAAAAAPSGSNARSVFAPDLALALTVSVLSCPVEVGGQETQVFLTTLLPAGKDGFPALWPKDRSAWFLPGSCQFATTSFASGHSLPWEWPVVLLPEQWNPALAAPSKDAEREGQPSTSSSLTASASAALWTPTSVPALAVGVSLYDDRHAFIPLAPFIAQLATAAAARAAASGGGGGSGGQGLSFDSGVMWLLNPQLRAVDWPNHPTARVAIRLTGQTTFINATPTLSISAPTAPGGGTHVSPSPFASTATAAAAAPAMTPSDAKSSSAGAGAGTALETEVRNTEAPAVESPAPPGGASAAASSLSSSSGSAGVGAGAGAAAPSSASLVALANALGRALAHEEQLVAELAACRAQLAAALAQRR